MQKVYIKKHPLCQEFYEYHWAINYSIEHLHCDYAEIIFPNVSHVRNYINGNMTFLQEKTVYICAPQTTHKIHYNQLQRSNVCNHFNLSLRDQDFYSLCSQVSGSLIDYIQENKFIEIPLCDEEHNYLQYLIGQLRSITDKSKTTKIIKHIVRTVLVICDQKRKMVVQNQTDRYALDVKNKIDNLEYINIEVGDIYSKYPISFSFLIKSFKKLTGKTIANYVIEKKLEYSKLLLISTLMPITEIAQTVGYSSSYFINRFNKSYDITPMQYRKKYSNTLPSPTK